MKYRLSTVEQAALLVLQQPGLAEQVTRQGGVSAGARLAALNGLVGRGYATRDYGHISPVSGLAVLIAVCSYPNLTVAAVYSQSGEPADLRQYHWTREVIALDALVPGGHELERLVPDDLVPRLTRHLRLKEQPALGVQGARMSVQAFEEARQAANQGDRMATAAAVGKEGLSGEQVGVIAGALCDSTAMAAVALTRWVEPRATYRWVMMHAPQGVMQVRYIPGKKVELSGRSASELAAELRQGVNGMIADLS